MAIAWHPSKWWDWCVPEDEKTETEFFFVGINMDLFASDDRIH